IAVDCNDYEASGGAMTCRWRRRVGNRCGRSGHGLVKAPRGVCHTGTVMAAQLTFVPPRRAKPPRHLADLSADERREAVAELGEKPFRADQLSRPYFGRLADDPADMTDLPTATRDRLVAALMPPLLTSVRDQVCDAGATRKTLWRAFDGTLLES